MSNAYEYRQKIIDKITEALFQNQIRYWNRELKVLSDENRNSYHTYSVLNYIIFYENKGWYPLTLSNDKQSSPLRLHLNPDFPEFDRRMQVIACEMEELQKEIYEAKRFLGGLLLFAITPEQLERILGASLYSECAKAFSGHRPIYPNLEENLVGESLQDYVQSNKDIIQAMNERLILNLITPSGL